MDTVTHAISGAVIGIATGRRGEVHTLRRRAMWGALFAAFPDSDIAILLFTDHFTYLNAHRGLTHSIFMLPLWAALLGGRAQEVTERLVVRLVERPRGRSLEAGLTALSALAAERRNRSVAVVTSAVPLSERQRQRLAAALGTLYGRPVQLNLDVDSAVLGGISVRVGDEVISGTISERLDEVARRMAG
jgi:hypothetical protein